MTTDSPVIATVQQCCAKFCLSQQPDFLAQKKWLTEVVTLRGHEIIFYPKYHCELNYIKMIWGYLKSLLRRKCTYNYKDLKNKIPDFLENKIPLSFIRRASRHCFRFMSAYRVKDLDQTMLNYCMKKYSSHRRIPFTTLPEHMRNEISESLAK